MRVAFIAEFCSAIPFINLSSGTISDTSACLLGMLRAISEPLTTPATMRCQKATRSVRSSVAMASVTSALPACARISSLRLGILSASAPAITDTNITGRANDMVTRDTASGESSVSSRTSHTRATICMFMAVNEAMELPHSHRKSGMLRDSKVSAPMPRRSLGRLADTAACSVAAAFGGRGAMSDTRKAYTDAGGRSTALQQ